MNRYKYNPRIGGNNSSAGGLSKIDDFYQVFHRIRARCCYKGNKDYMRYGGRWITFDWKDYPSFKKDMYKQYLKHKGENDSTSIERIDVNGSYSKENCKWITMQEQAKNRRTNRYITYKGRTMIIADWARELDTSRQTIRHRLEQGWTPEQIVETKVSYSNRINKK